MAGKKKAVKGKPKLNFIVTKDMDGEYSWVARTINGKAVAESEHYYPRKRDCMSSINTLCTHIGNHSFEVITVG